MNDKPDNNELPTDIKPFDETGSAPEPEIDLGPPEVATPQKRTALVLGVLILALMGSLYMIFSGPDPKPTTPVNTVKPKKATTSLSKAPPVPVFDVPPPKPPVRKKETPTIPPPPKPPTIPQAVKAQPKAPATPNAQQMLRRQNSSMLKMSGGFSPESAEDKKKKGVRTSTSNNPDERFSNMVLTESGAEREEARIIEGDIHSSVFQGKIIEAVLETAVDTSLPGLMRAVISRDVYAEAGKAILVPKGSRMIGVYNTSIRRGQKRLFVIWTRIILPNGIDIQVGSPGVDNLGRAGMAAEVNNRFFEIFGGSLLISSVGIGFAYGAEELLGLQGVSETRNEDGSTTRSGTNTDIATYEALEQLGDLSAGLLAEMLDTRPIMYLDQGTKIKVFVNRDLIFPPGTGSGGISYIY